MVLCGVDQWIQLLLYVQEAAIESFFCSKIYRVSTGHFLLIHAVYLHTGGSQVYNTLFSIQYCICQVYAKTNTIVFLTLSREVSTRPCNATACWQIVPLIAPSETINLGGWSFKWSKSTWAFLAHCGFVATLLGWGEVCEQLRICGLALSWRHVVVSFRILLHWLIS